MFKDRRFAAAAPVNILSVRFSPIRSRISVRKAGAEYPEQPTFFIAQDDEIMVEARLCGKSLVRIRRRFRWSVE
jgi:hypothetical protein